jgi:hypothetical protein
VLICLDVHFTDIFGQPHTEQQWLIGETRDKHFTLGTDHHASEFRSTDAGFINRIAYQGSEESR